MRYSSIVSSKQSQKSAHGIISQRKEDVILFHQHLGLNFITKLRLSCSYSTIVLIVLLWCISVKHGVAKKLQKSSKLKLLIQFWWNWPQIRFVWVCDFVSEMLSLTFFDLLFIFCHLLKLCLALKYCYQSNIFFCWLCKQNNIADIRKWGIYLM